VNCSAFDTCHFTDTSLSPELVTRIILGNSCRGSHYLLIPDFRFYYRKFPLFRTIARVDTSVCRGVDN
jgi:hypothetical protein